MGQTPTVIFKYACHLLTRPRSHIRICTRHIHAHTTRHTWPGKNSSAIFLVIATKTLNLDASRSFPKTPEWRANFKQPLALLSFFLRPPFLILSFQGEKKAGFPFVCRPVLLFAQERQNSLCAFRFHTSTRDTRPGRRAGTGRRGETHENTRTNQARSSLITSVHV